MSGAFGGLEDIIKKRVQKQSIGFESAVSSGKASGRLLKQVKAEDLIEFGFESEFVGRLPVVAVLNELTEDDFRAYSISLQFEKEAFREIAKLAVQEQTGARGLLSVMEKVLLHYEKKLPSTDISHLVVDVAIVYDPIAELERFLSDSALQEKHRLRYEELVQEEYVKLVDFITQTMGDYLEDHKVLATPDRLRLMAKESHENDLDPREVCDIFIELVQTIHECEAAASVKSGITVTFSEEAIDRFLAKKPRKPDMIRQACENVLSVMEYGLRLLSQKKDVDSVLIPASGVDAPEQFINKLVEETFKVE